jgi:hypothetical protein
MLIPPPHPEVAKNGIDFDLVLSVMDEALANMLLDYQENAPSSLKVWDGEKDIDIPQLKDGKLTYLEAKVIHNERFGDKLYFTGFPFTTTLAVEFHSISPLGSGFDHYIRIAEGRSWNILIPKEHQSTPQFIEEYSLQPGGEYLLGKYLRFVSPNGWLYHNVDFNGIIYKNLVIAINNEVVRRKYGES